MKTQALLLVCASLGFAASANAASVKPAQAAKARAVLAKVIPAYYGADKAGTDFGVVTAVGKPRISATKTPNVYKATGTFNDNELSGGAYNYRYSVNVNVKTKRVMQLKAPVQTRETN